MTYGMIFTLACPCGGFLSRSCAPSRRMRIHGRPGMLEFIAGYLLKAQTDAEVANDTLADHKAAASAWT